MKVERTEVKKCFVASEIGKDGLRGKERVEFKNALDKIRNEVQAMNEGKLDRLIKDPRRLRDYDRLLWTFEECSIDHVGVWYGYNPLGFPEGAGGLPAEWCTGSVRETAQKIRENPKEVAQLKANARDKRASQNLFGILERVDLILNNPSFAPIVLPGGSLRPFPCRKLQGDIDDGCLRAIAFALKGHERFSAYVGKIE
jgi:hypothetical protein